MKKIIILASIIILTGCGNKITCKTVSDKNASISEEYKISYKENEVTGLTLIKYYKFDNKKELDSYLPTIEYYKVSETNENTSVKYKKKRKKYILTKEYDIKNMQEEELNKIGLSKDKEKLTTILKNNGLICK